MLSKQDLKMALDVSSRIGWNVIGEFNQAAKRPYARFKKGVNLSDHVNVRSAKDGSTVTEFIGTGNFPRSFITRQQYEVDAGRDEEPILYLPFFAQTIDENLPKHVEIELLGPGGMAFEEVKEGGEAVFVTVGSSSKTVEIKHFASGIEYTKDIWKFNQTWRLAPIERWFGIAHNALLNHIHLSTFLNATYGADNQTPANATSGETLAELYLLTLEDAITNATADTTNPRRAPYNLLISVSDFFMVSRGLLRRLQDGINVQSPSIAMINDVVVYDGWTNARSPRGKVVTTYPGVTAGKAYLVSTQYQMMDHHSYVAQELQMTMGNPDVSRFILEQQIWDSYYGVYSRPVGSTEEITWPEVS